MVQQLSAVLVLALVPGLRAMEQAPDPNLEGAVEAAFRQQLELWLTPDARKANTVVCLALEPSVSGQGVSADQLTRFGGEDAVRRGADCSLRGGAAVERSSGRPAVLVTATGLERIAPDEVWVTLRYYSSAHSNGSRQYRVVREGARWVSLGPIIRGLPLE